MRNLLCMLMIFTAIVCSEQEKVLELLVSNPTSLNRTNEVTEVSADILDAFNGAEFIVLDEEGKQIPYQVTSDSKLIFPVTVAAKGSATYRIKAGQPEEFKVMAYGKHYPERVDDIAWENDRIAFRTYGPALQATGEQAFGYDVWVKRVHDMVVKDRYATELNPETNARIVELKKTDPVAAQALADSISYHIDHGNDLDYYSVGPTLGGGTSALWVNDDIVYPYCYTQYEILDNGPLRFKVKLVYNPLTIGDNSSVVETRIISLDAYSQLNKITVSYSNLDAPQTVVTGIVIHAPSEEYQADAQAGYIAYAEPVETENGQTYVGAVFPNSVDKAEAVFFPEAEAKNRKAEGHVLAFSTYEPDSEYVYYAGGGWNKWEFASSFAWFKYIQEYAQKVREPLEITIQ